MTSKEAYYLTAAETGCPKDQLENYERSGIKAVPRQLQFAAACRECDKSDGPTEVAYAGALGGGKSLAAIVQVGVDDCQRFKGLKALLLRKVGKANIENFGDLRIKAFGALPHSWRTNGELTFANGSRIIAGHYKDERDIDKYLGLEYDAILVEEATTLSAKKFEYIATRCRTSKPGWRPRIYLTANPGGVGHFWFKTRFVMPHRRKTQSETRYIHSLPTDNPWINPVYFQRLQKLTGWERRAWLEGDWDIAAGQFFTRFRMEIHVDSIATFDERKIRRWWGALDWGHTHPCVFLLLGEDGDGNLYALYEHCAAQMLPATHAEHIKDLLKRARKHDGGMTVDDLEGIFTGSDTFAEESDGVSIAQKFEAAGVTLQSANMERVNGWGEITELLGDSEVLPPYPKIPARLFIHPRCVRLVETLPMLEHDPNHPEDVLKWDVDDQGNGGDDAPDALRYGVASKPSKVTMVKVRG